MLFDDKDLTMFTTYPILVNIIRENEPGFEYICEHYIKSPNGLKHYRLFYPNDKRSIYYFFIETPSRVASNKTV